MTVQPTTKQFLPTFQRSASSAFAPIQREFNRLFDELATGWTAFTDADLTPSMDVRETEDTVEISMELPGIEMADVKIALEDHVLTVRGEKKSETEEKDEHRRVSERIYGAFARSMSLPSSVDPEKVTASMDKGVLKITAPKDKAAKAKTIEIQSAK